MKPFYLTTTLPYVNAEPHIGHALEFVQADVICRWRKQCGDEVVFNVGTDEHGLKILQKAESLAMGVEAFVEMHAGTFGEFFKSLLISYTNFYRTSSPGHIAVAQEMRKRCDVNGDIYTKNYTGLYCVGCESFKTDKDLIDGLCPDHQKAPIPYAQENYFFRLSKYRKPLRDYFTSTEALLPPSKLLELLNFIDSMDDISISRTKEHLPRGVPVPGDPEQVMYVWFDALSNYLGAIGFPDDLEQVSKFRPGMQVFGPDNIRFQCAIWQAMLLSAGFSCSETLLMHGMILGPDGNKMSKTIGNVISPKEQIEKYGAEAVRFYLIAGTPTFGDSAYKEDDLVSLYNSRLANAFGNLLSRVITLANNADLSLQTGMLSDEATTHIQTKKEKAIDQYSHYQLFDASHTIHDLVMRGNKYLDEKKPREKSTESQVVVQTLNDLGELLRTVIGLYSPLLPNACTHATHLLKTQTKGILFPKL